MPEAPPLRLAIVGCGAMSELGHLPALLATDRIVPTILIDPDEARAKALAGKFGVARHSTRLADAVGVADAACIVVPHHVHVDAAVEAIGYGLHILIEKPLGVTVRDCDAIIDAARMQKVVLAVAMFRRFARSNRFLKAVLTSEPFGPARSFKLVSGVSGVWPTKSAYLLSPDHSGGGVLMSNGVHDMDVLAWLFNRPDQIEFFADADFGKRRLLESDVFIKMLTASGIPGTVELSRSRNLENGLWVEFERATVRAPLYDDHVSIKFAGHDEMELESQLFDGAPHGARQTFVDILTDQLNDFAGAVRDGRRPMVDGADARQTIATLEQCYSNVRLLDTPWRRPIILPERT